MDYTTIEMLAAAQDGRNPGGGRPFVQTGMSFKRYGAREGAAHPMEVEVLSAGSHGRHGLLASEFEHLVLDVSDRLARRIDELRTREGDVVISLSSPFPAVYVGPEFENVLVPSGMALIRADEGTREVVDPRFLAGWLSSETVRECVLPSKLTATRAGVRQRTRRTLSEVDLLGVVVPLPPMEEQRKLGDLVASSAKAEVQRWAQQRAEDHIVEFYYWKTCVESSYEEGMAVGNDEGSDFASVNGNLASEMDGRNVTDAIAGTRMAYPTDGSGTGGMYTADGGNGYQGTGNPAVNVPDFLRQPLDHVDAGAFQAAAAAPPSWADGTSPTGLDYRQMERLITPEWYETYIQGSDEASRQFLESFRSIAGTDEGPDASPGYAQTIPGDSPPDAYGVDDDPGGPPGDGWRDPYEVRIF